ncbi:alkyl hydroperoxide reductase thiol specific antioxidant mal allergen : Uncharacterized protein OS=Hyphomonas sp. L-53-1-40 GN=L53_08670 PE=4 SV=1: AhpC-TSA [Gemmataceae bacterium]|nr:alkyl hydroperoxide reductase thiol specific antioxidant mal allergen : Uncharacterized protein OS=Hyphomonas sp. L-53-1-40 GN=L53_08670 PE=4 SV=1: AhpC-TSA [Gemmataceae bacterium]VTT99551.1 alkyl hydroperoxide reductase thiol specific antioxidant mal allergen : Uncharacterized protein OS=Hyphomonas sp. L-53-1-40 GN=L53_08670 PE=4 SV=1: AhpC-TSA [Gemmataceae bacterium]
MFRISATALCLGFLATITTAADPAPEEKTGLKVGTKAPAFTLKDQNGKERALSEFTKKGKVAVVFYRSAGWCPFCQKQLVQLQKDVKKLEDAGVTVIGISYDPVDVLAKFAENQKIMFPLLSDPESKTIKAFGVLNADAKGKTEGIPHPGTMIIDRDGVIRAKLFFEGYKERSGADAIVKAAADVK